MHILLMDALVRHVKLIYFFTPKMDGILTGGILTTILQRRKWDHQLELLKPITEKLIFQKKSKQTEITYWEVLPGDRIGVSSMIGASKLISKYRKFFNPKDIDFLLNRKKYSGEQTEIRPIKKFYLNREDQDKYNHLLDKNDHIIFTC